MIKSRKIRVVLLMDRGVRRFAGADYGLEIG